MGVISKQYSFIGVLMWEVFTAGKMPYGRLKNTEVVERVQRGIILEKPKACAKEIYDVRFHELLILQFGFNNSIILGHEKVLVT
jgi:hypothetical protein